MSSWHSYPSIYTLGHRAVKDIFSVPCNIEEKIDGSQFSFGKFELPDGTTELRIRSKGAVMNINAPEKMFTKAAETVRQLESLLHPGWTYRAEYLQKPKHNALVYDRTPFQYLIIFDVCIGEEDYLPYGSKALEAARLGLEVVPLLGTVFGDCYDTLRNIIDNTMSCLGGQKIEGVVIKPSAANVFGPDKKLLLAKFVSEAFKEVHAAVWKNGGEFKNHTHKDILEQLAMKYTSSARWHKAVQHMRDASKLEDSPRDIGLLMQEIPNDIAKECREDICDMLFNWAWRDLKRSVVRGFPEWYKEELLKQQFEKDTQ